MSSYATCPNFTIFFTLLSPKVPSPGRHDSWFHINKTTKFYLNCCTHQAIWFDVLHDYILQTWFLILNTPSPSSPSPRACMAHGSQRKPVWYFTFETDCLYKISKLYILYKVHYNCIFFKKCPHPRGQIKIPRELRTLLSQGRTYCKVSRF